MTTWRRPGLARLAMILSVAAAVLLPASIARADGPRPQNPVGATVQVTDPTAAPGAELSFTGTGFRNDRGTGQVVSVKLDDVDLLGQATADSSGALTGSVTLPADITPGDHWLRFLAGSGQDNDSPARSLVGTFTVVAAASTSTPATAPAGAEDSTASAGSGSTTSTVADLAELPKTGVDVVPWLTATAVFALLALGFGSAAWLRRRSGHR